jgi:hypothetical protein
MSRYLLESREGVRTPGGCHEFLPRSGQQILDGINRAPGPGVHIFSF